MRKKQYNYIPANQGWPKVTFSPIVIVKVNFRPIVIDSGLNPILTRFWLIFNHFKCIQVYRRNTFKLFYIYFCRGWYWQPHKQMQWMKIRSYFQKQSFDWWCMPIFVFYWYIRAVMIFSWHYRHLFVCSPVHDCLHELLTAHESEEYLSFNFMNVA